MKKLNGKESRRRTKGRKRLALKIRTVSVWSSIANGGLDILSTSEILEKCGD